MIIESIRLRNIKSYREGPDGKGILIGFQTGVNRVAGRNGHGKTTIIESLGYALFLTDPQFEENFPIETYFLSHGAKEGDIEVTFQCDGETYRIERPVGKQNRRRSKVIQMRDGSICAEDKEVGGFLCRLLKFPDCGQLSEVFRKLIGIKQGRLTWPFDSTPKLAKEHFEPLFGVKIFRDCFDELKGAVDIFQAQRQEHSIALGGVEAQIKDRKDAPAALQTAQEAARTGEAKLKVAQAEHEVARKTKEALEISEQNVKTAEGARATAQQSLSHASDLRKAAEAEVAAAEAAARAVKENEAAHTLHNEALVALDQLERKRRQRDALKEQRDGQQQGMASEESKADAAHQQAQLLAEQNTVKETERAAFRGQIAELRGALDATGPAFNKAGDEAKTAQVEAQQISDWMASLDRANRELQRTAEKMTSLAGHVAHWDEGKLKQAEEAEIAASQKLKDAEQRQAATIQNQQTLQQQLTKIQGGVCPFLKETCRQFDPSKVMADVNAGQTAVAALGAEVAASKLHHDHSLKALQTLRNTSNDIKHQRKQLEECLQTYGGGIESLKDERVAVAIRWLGKWDANIGPAPVLPQFAKPAASETVQQFHPRLAAYVEQTRAWWDQTNTILKTRDRAFSEIRDQRGRDEATLKEKERAVERLKTEIDSNAQKQQIKLAETKRHDEQRRIFAEQVRKLDEQLSPFAGLEDLFQREQRKRDENREGFTKFIEAKKAAAELPARSQRLAEKKQSEGAAHGTLEAAIRALETARSSFDPEILKAARADADTKRDLVTGLGVSLAQAQKEVERERKRVAEFENACGERDRVQRLIARCEASIQITELARKTLRDTAPAVAQSLCHRIAVHAQRVFNQISAEPIEIAWDAERYSMRIAPGDRRFAMLSGGEQTKLALAMTLAMIEQFSGLRFCVFDEPIYGVDADGRQKLADTILEAQRAAGLEQLLLVSHDDVFDGKIDQTIVLEKSAAQGTQVAA